MFRFKLSVLFCVQLSLLTYGVLYEPRECKRSRKGAEYMGTLNVSSSGRECQRWDVQEPHEHVFTNALYFPDRDFDSAANHCRNPDKDTVPWCYTTDPSVRYEYCDVPVCDDVYPSCTTTQSGKDYMGSVSVTEADNMCRYWSEMTEAQRQYMKDNAVSSKSILELTDLGSNYCRNPDGRDSGPWCFVGDGISDCEYCAISICKPSASCTTTQQGTEYAGKRGLTVSDRPCQRWDRQFPHTHNFTDPDMFPDAEITEAENFCRNPGASQNALWCYTTDPEVEWEYCDIPICSGCKHTVDGRGYAGTESTSVSGLPCQTWISHGMNDSNQFPDVSVEYASNYCRNPDSKEEGVWCYTGDSDIEWELCDIPLCQGDCQSDSKDRRTFKHVVHFGIDGLHATSWQNASSGVPNLLQLASEGSHTYSKARAELQTWSAPNWAAHLCGMGMEETGVTENSWLPPWMGRSWPITPVTGLNYPLPCVMHYLKGMDANIRTAAFPNWDWFYELTGRGYPGTVDVDYFCEIDYPAGLSCDWELVGNASEYIKLIRQSAENSYTFISIDEVDSKGHSFGWCTPPYLNAVNEADAMLGLLMEAVQGEDVLFIVSSDHGGGLDGHGNYRDRDLHIPMWIKGSGVKVNYEIQGQVRNRDIGPTLVWAMGLEGSKYWNGDIMYEIFED